MPNPTISSLHVDSLLTNMSVLYSQEKEGFIIDKLLPRLDVKKQSDRYNIWSQADFMRIQVQLTGDTDKAPIAGFRNDTTPTYFAKVYKLKKMITALQRANATSPLNIDRATVNFLTQQLLMKREQIGLNAIFTTGAWTTDINGDATPDSSELLHWDDAASTPFEDVRAKATLIKRLTGRRPNKLVVGPLVDDVLREHPDILDKIKYTGQGGFVQNRDLAQAFNVKEYLVSDAIYNAAGEDTAETYTGTHFAGKHALLLYTTDSPSLDEPSGGYMFSWSPFDKVSNGAAAIRRWKIEDPIAEWLHGEMAFVPKITAPGAGVFFNGIIS